MNRKPPDDPSETHPAAAATIRDYGKLSVSRFDLVTSFLAALMLLLGTLVSLLAIVWIVSGDSVTRSGPPPYPEVIWGTVHSIALTHDFLQPGGEEVVALDEPSPQETLSAIDAAAGGVVGSDLADGSSPSTQNGQSGPGDARLPGPEGRLDIVPRFQRWQLRFTARDVQSYARQLDHYGIELGVIGGGVQGVDYVSHLSTSPKLRRGDSSAESRLYFMWNHPSDLMQLDCQLLLAAGATLDGREILKFVPEALENELARIELEYAMSRGHGSLQSIARTVFTSQSTGDGCRFIVSQQRYRKQYDGSVVLERINP